MLRMGSNPRFNNIVFFTFKILTGEGKKIGDNKKNGKINMAPSLGLIIYIIIR